MFPESMSLALRPGLFDTESDWLGMLSCKSDRSGPHLPGAFGYLDCGRQYQESWGLVPGVYLT